MAPRTPTLSLSLPPPSPLRLQSANGNQQTPISTATVSMVHSVPELMVSSEVSLDRKWRDQEDVVESILDFKVILKYETYKGALQVFVLYKYQ